MDSFCNFNENISSFQIPNSCPPPYQSFSQISSFGGREIAFRIKMMFDFLINLKLKVDLVNILITFVWKLQNEYKLCPFEEYLILDFLFVYLNNCLLKKLEAILEGKQKINWKKEFVILEKDGDEYWKCFLESEYFLNFKNIVEKSLIYTNNLVTQKISEMESENNFKNKEFTGLLTTIKNSNDNMTKFESLLNIKFKIFKNRISKELKENEKNDPNLEFSEKSKEYLKVFYLASLLSNTQTYFKWDSQKRSGKMTIEEVEKCLEDDKKLILFYQLKQKEEDFIFLFDF